ncbi:hypothetical protein L1887_02971 [Cichorium endivia]|nr:hypothetical protein L1887_02971 [Cichorium endivia]
MNSLRSSQSPHSLFSLKNCQILHSQHLTPPFSCISFKVRTLSHALLTQRQKAFKFACFLHWLLRSDGCFLEVDRIFRLADCGGGGGGRWVVSRWVLQLM